jgi:hypothetical protein
MVKMTYLLEGERHAPCSAQYASISPQNPRVDLDAGSATRVPALLNSLVNFLLGSFSARGSSPEV